MREKNPKRVAAGRLNGLKSGMARRAASSLLSDEERSRKDAAALHALRAAAQSRARAADRRRARYWQAVADGKCVDCGLLVSHGVRCTDCTRTAADLAKAYYHAHAEARRAYQRRYYHAKKAARHAA